MRVKTLVLGSMVLGLVLAGCAGGATTEPPATSPPAEAATEAPTEAPPPAPESIRVGAVIPLTGAFAGGGAQVQRGYELAVDAINAAGGVYVAEYDAQIPIELIELDDASDPNMTVSHLETLNTDQEVVA